MFDDCVRYDAGFQTHEYASLKALKVIFLFLSFFIYFERERERERERSRRGAEGERENPKRLHA